MCDRRWAKTTRLIAAAGGTAEIARERLADGQAAPKGAWIHFAPTASVSLTR